MEHATFVLTDPLELRPDRPQARYEDDVHAWAFEQAELLKAGRFEDLDLTNLADEVADVGHRQFSVLESDLALVIQHLLKWDHQPERCRRSWANSIREHQKRIVRRLAKIPSLKARQVEALEDAYERGRGDALIEAGLDEAVFPVIIPYNWDDVMTRPIAWPEP